MSIQQLILPAVATFGAIYCAKKIIEFTNQDHTRIASKSDTPIVIPHETFPNLFKSSTTGIILATRRYLVPATHCKGLVFFLHGFTEHSARYEGLSYELNKLGYSVCLIDHQGHGGSGGERSYTINFLDYVTDVIDWMNNEYNNMLYQKAGWAVPGFELDKQKIADIVAKNIVIGAHSMGGLIASRLGIHIKSNPGLIPWLDLKNSPPRFFLSAPALALDKQLIDVPILLKISAILSKVLPKVPVQSMPSVELATDPNITKIAHLDPHINGPTVVARFGAEFVASIQYAQDHATEFDFPILIVQSDQDNIVNSQGSKDFFEKVSTSTDKKHYLKVEGLHEVLFDKDRTKILENIASFLTLHYIK